MSKKKKILCHSQGTLTDEQLEIAKIYVDMLYKFRNKPIKDALYTIGDYNLVQHLGDGDPIKAAEKHRDVINEMHAEILLSAGDRSKMVH